MPVQNKARQRRYYDVEAKAAISRVRNKHMHNVVFYGLSDRIAGLIREPGFSDGILALLTFLGAAVALRFYPLVILIPLAAVIFFVTARKPFPGLILLIILLMPMVVYQTPGLAWFYLLIAAGSLIYGYMYHKPLLFLYAIIAFSFSQIGLLLTIPLMIIGVLRIGYKRAVIMSVLFVLAIVFISGVTGLQNSSYIIYSATAAHAATVPASLSQYVVPSKPGLNVMTFVHGSSQAAALFTSGAVISATSEIAGSIVATLGIMPQYYLAQMVILAIIVFGIDGVAVASRSKYKGTHASIIGLGYPIIAIALAYAAKLSLPYYLLAVSFAAALLSVYLLESSGVNVTKSLEIRKQDLRMKFGEAFEDLEAGNVNETFDNIANYAATKRELTEAVLAPIEERAISKAYNVKPAKGILFFGPPGTGKTLMMRALANEIHAGFFYVKAPNLISSFPGETERAISNIFTIAKKNAPCVLFFDEIDSIAQRRGDGMNEASRQAVSQLLVEMDGFQKTNNVIMVGATNAPNLIDPAMMRPGRFDKIIYLPPPDFNARVQIFDLFLRHLPMANDVSLDKLAEETERFTGADIKVLCETVAQRVSQEAAAKHTILQITEEDLIDRINATKPSVSLAQIEQYQKFRLDFERSAYGQTGEEASSTATSMREVIGLEDAKKVIMDAIETPLVHPELVKKYGIKSVNGILIFGPPGTGKTMLLRAIKSEMEGITMLELNGAELSDQGVERATATIKEVFNRAKENAPSIILLDEVEEMLLKRGMASEYSAQITSEMLRELDGISEMGNVVVIGTTNRPDAIDAAALRPGRLDKLVFVKPPSKSQRAQMFKLFLKGVPVGSIDYDALAEETTGFTGADIYHVCREVKTMMLDRTVKEGKEVKIEEADLMAVIQKVKPSAPEDVVSQYLSFYSKYGER
ncbi:MAG: AAA family ATPase [Candidatus Marsarchaeota archaeon]|jgi:SpoVK/Ycf46/Vps4 family AAA+-type ATPase|nr:AAA family ATPase [Candidatus Marsarchaeota archaeon]MCL5111366.1 AAA family ATPase [Candidatus Marsarchaeota archaeon]